MAKIQGNQVLLDNGQLITPETGGWYDAQQFWGGTLSAPGVINSLSNQQGAGQAVNPEVVKQSNIDQGLIPGTNEAYIAKQQQIVNPSGGAGTGNPSTTGVVSDSQKAYDALNSSMNAKRAEADKRRSEVNENPFLAEASRVGRIAKIDSMLNDSLATDQIQLTNLEKKVAAEAEASKPDLMITTETDSNGNVNIISVDKKTGALVSVKSAGKLGKGTTGSTTAGLKAAATTISSLLNANANEYGHVDPITFSEIRETFIAEGLGTRDEFNKKYAGMTSPNEPNFNGVYGFDKELRSKWTTGATTATEQLIEAFNNANSGGN